MHLKHKYTRLLDYAYVQFLYQTSEFSKKTPFTRALNPRMLSSDVCTCPRWTLLSWTWLKYRSTCITLMFNFTLISDWPSWLCILYNMKKMIIVMPGTLHALGGMWFFWSKYLSALPFFWKKGGGACKKNIRKLTEYQ